MPATSLNALSPRRGAVEPVSVAIPKLAVQQVQPIDEVARPVMEGAHASGGTIGKVAVVARGAGEIATELTVPLDRDHTGAQKSAQQVQRPHRVTAATRTVNIYNIHKNIGQCACVNEISCLLTGRCIAPPAPAALCARSKRRMASCALLPSWMKTKTRSRLRALIKILGAEAEKIMEGRALAHRHAGESEGAEFWQRVASAVRTILDGRV
jgi:hypothetical protein